jgi:thioredoxin 1
MSQIQHINGVGAFDSFVREQKGFVLVDFWAEWCNPCRILAPIIEELAKERDDVAVAKVDVDKNQELAMRFGIQSIPTVIAFYNGEEAERFVGVRDKAFYTHALGELKKEMDNPSAEKKIIVFSTPTCPWCQRLKSYLKEHNVAFEDKDVSRDQEAAIAMVQKSGEMGVPQMWVGRQVVIGFDHERIDQLLKLDHAHHDHA